MITFLPYADFAKSALVLDSQRLGKQRSEALAILNVILGIRPGPLNNPAFKMWLGHEWHLARYGWIVCEAWRQRGFKDSLKTTFNVVMAVRPMSAPPAWLGDERLHSSHRARLLEKNHFHYSQFGWMESPSSEYWWPC